NDQRATHRRCALFFLVRLWAVFTNALLGLECQQTLNEFWPDRPANKKSGEEGHKRPESDVTKHIEARKGVRVIGEQTIDHVLSPQCSKTRSKRWPRDAFTATKSLGPSKFLMVVEMSASKSFERCRVPPKPLLFTPSSTSAACG